MMSALYCDETLSPLAVAKQCTKRERDTSPVFLSRAPVKRFRDSSLLAIGAQTPTSALPTNVAQTPTSALPTTVASLSQNCTPAVCGETSEETSDDLQTRTKPETRSAYAIAEVGIAALCAALSVTAADRSPAPTSVPWHWSGWWALSSDQRDSLQMYASVADMLSDVMVRRRCATAQAIALVARERLRAATREEREEHASEIKKLRVQEDALSDGLIGLYVAQALDWTLAVQQSSLCAAQNAALLPEEVRAQTLALACVALALVCKTFHSDMDVDVDPERVALAQVTHCSARTLDKIEALLMRALDYRLHSMGDCFTVLAYHSDTLPIDAAAMQEVRDDPVALERIGARLFRMLWPSNIEAFASLSPWVRTTLACVDEVRQRYDTPLAALYELERRGEIAAADVWRCAPSKQDAQSLCHELALD